MESKDKQPSVGYLTTYGAHGLVEVSSFEVIRSDRLKGEMAKIWRTCYWLDRLALTPTGKPGVWGSVIKDDDKPKVVAAWPKIVSAALRWADRDNLTICSPRHFDTTCHAIMRAAGVTKIGAERTRSDAADEYQQPLIP